VKGAVDAIGSKKSSLKGSPKGSPKTAELLIEFIQKDSSITTERLGELLGISKRAVLKQIDKLKEQGRLRRVGSARGGHWQVLN
jgi:ATP-dependent DNA helicase RecG